MSAAAAIKKIDINYDYDGAPTILGFNRDYSFFTGIMGPFGSGKSSGCVIKVIERALEQEPCFDGIRRVKVAVVRNTYPQLEDTTIRTFFEWLPPMYCGKYNKKEHIYKITCFKNTEIEVIFRALDKPEHVSNLLSLELTFAWVNEAREVPWEIIKVLGLRVNRFPSRKSSNGATWSGIFMDTNPPDTQSWWYKFFEIDKPENAKIYKQPSGRAKNAENLRHLAPSYYEDLVGTIDEDEIKVYIDGEYGFIKSGKPVYNEFKDNLHSKIGLKPIPGIPIIRGWDFGLTPAAVLGQVTPMGQLRLLREYTTNRAGIDQFSDAVLKDMKVRYPNVEWRDIGDPSGAYAKDTDESDCFKILQGKGVDIQASTNEPRIRLESVKRGLTTMIDGEPAIVVDADNCPISRQGFQGGYKYRKIAATGGGIDERWQDKPLKNLYSHPHDAIQYICVEVFGDFVQGLNPTKDAKTQQTIALHDFDPLADDYEAGYNDNQQAEAMHDFDPWAI